MLLVQSPSLVFALIFTIISLSFTIAILAHDHTYWTSVVHLLIILPPLNCVFVFLTCGTWIERRFRVSYIPLICLILLICSTLTSTILSTEFWSHCPLFYVYFVYHCFLCIFFLFLILTTIVAYTYGALCIHRYRNMMTITQQNSEFPTDVNALKIDKLILKSNNNNDEFCIFMSILPGRRIRHDIRQLSIDLNQIQVDTILTLNELKEFSFMNMANGNNFDMKTYSNHIQQANIEHIFYPIRDRFIPISISDYIEFILLLLMNMNSNQYHRILVHCMGGMGRTGMTVVCLELVYEYLMNESKTKKQSMIERFMHYPFLLDKYCRVCRAIRNVRQARRGTIHNPLQIWFVHEFYARLKCVSYMKQIMDVVIANEKLISNRVDTSYSRSTIPT